MKYLPVPKYQEHIVCPTCESSCKLIGWVHDNTLYNCEKCEEVYEVYI